MILRPRHRRPLPRNVLATEQRSKPHLPLPLRVLRRAPLRPASTSTASTPQPPPPVYIPPPTETSGPLLTRLPNRALPTLAKSHTWLKTLPLFILLITISSLGIFNYQKASSSTVNSILYALRTNATAREILGDEIYFASKVPWIRGELNQLHGRIDISFWVKGRRQQGRVKFVSVRKRRDGFFETLEWSLTTEEGATVQLLDGADPFTRQGSTSVA